MEIPTVSLKEIPNDNGITGVRIQKGTRCDVQIGTTCSAALVPIGHLTTELDLVVRVLEPVIDPESGKKVGIQGIVTTEQAIKREPEAHELRVQFNFWFSQSMHEAQQSEACRLACQGGHLQEAIRSIAQVSPRLVVEMFVTVMFENAPSLEVIM